MNSKIRIIFVVFFFCAFITNLIIIFYQQKKIKFFSEREATLLAEQMRVENILLKGGFFQSYGYENTIIDYSTYVSNANDEIIKLQDLLSDKNSLILLMRVGSCRCVICKNRSVMRNGEIFLR